MKIMDPAGTQQYMVAMGMTTATGLLFEQDRFWEMHSLLFVSQPLLDRDHLRDYAKQLELNMVRFDEALHSHRHAERVKRDMRSGRESGVDGTPT
jgi:protein-disulfide isomerase